MKTSLQAFTIIRQLKTSTWVCNRACVCVCVCVCVRACACARARARARACACVIFSSGQRLVIECM